MYVLKNRHPGHEFYHLARLKMRVIQMVSLPKDKMCIEDVKHRREEYTNIALLMFYPFRTTQSLTLRSSYWEKSTASNYHGSPEIQRNVGSKGSKYHKILRTD